MLDSSIKRTIQGLLLEIERSLGKLAEDALAERFDAGLFLKHFEQFITLRNVLYEIHVINAFISGKPHPSLKVSMKLETAVYAEHTALPDLAQVIRVAAERGNIEAVRALVSRLQQVWLTQSFDAKKGHNLVGLFRMAVMTS